MTKITTNFRFQYPFVKKVIRNLSTQFESQYVDISAIAVLDSITGRLKVDLEEAVWDGKNILEFMQFHELDAEILEAAINHAHYILEKEAAA